MNSNNSLSIAQLAERKTVMAYKQLILRFPVQFRVGRVILFLFDEKNIMSFSSSIFYQFYCFNRFNNEVIANIGSQCDDKRTLMQATMKYW